VRIIINLSECGGVLIMAWLVCSDFVEREFVSRFSALRLKRRLVARGYDAHVLHVKENVWE